MADIIDLIYADHDWFRRQFFFLDDADDRRGAARDLGAARRPGWTPMPTPRRRSSTRRCSRWARPAIPRTRPRTRSTTTTRSGTPSPRPASTRSAPTTGSRRSAEARTENGEHLDEEEREALAGLHQERQPAAAARAGDALAGLLPPTPRRPRGRHVRQGRRGLHRGTQVARLGDTLRVRTILLKRLAGLLGVLTAGALAVSAIPRIGSTADQLSHIRSSHRSQQVLDGVPLAGGARADAEFYATALRILPKNAAYHLAVGPGPGCGSAILKFYGVAYLLLPRRRSATPVRPTGCWWKSAARRLPSGAASTG